MTSTISQLSIAGTQFQIMHTIACSCPWLKQMLKREEFKLSTETFVLMMANAHMAGLPNEIEHEYPVQSFSGWTFVKRKYKSVYLVSYKNHLYEFTGAGFIFADPDRYYGAGAIILAPARK
ncbi:MAG: hypothetical protein WCG55_02800 [bacterium]